MVHAHHTIDDHHVLTSDQENHRRLRQQQPGEIVRQVQGHPETLPLTPRAELNLVAVRWLML